MVPDAHIVQVPVLTGRPKLAEKILMCFIFAYPNLPMWQVTMMLGDKIIATEYS
jgi:hypothetical protein